ncbi:arylalkylamine N-acetyltransferase-like 2 [Condylostylus longicornis]|uniref:arylalkylamine N-acetyltransferase-like 2 n=1 Tax=Condylostylus longicornis TaxID=2530218 RepID=UPI00244E5ABF|nr:arylalkylamine N-acetyltransferase-like 2 [Condylostylus longicornis]
MSDIKVCAAIESDCNDILRFLRESYYPEEPLTLALKPFQQADEDEEFNMSCIKHGTCIIAYAEDDKNNATSVKTSSDIKNNGSEINSTTNTINARNLLGALIAGPKYPGEAEHLMDASNTVKSMKWSKMLKLLSYLELKSNVFENFNCQSAVHCHAMAVHQNARGKSIGLKMLKEFIKVCKNLKYPVITLDCTSVYSIKLCEKLNMVCLHEMNFEDYRNEHGEQVFTPPSPHKQIKTFAKRTDDDDVI